MITVVASVRNCWLSNTSDFIDISQNQAVERWVWLPGEMHTTHPTSVWAREKTMQVSLSRTVAVRGQLHWQRSSSINGRVQLKMNVLMSETGTFKMNFKFIQPAFIPEAFVCSCSQGRRMRIQGLFTKSNFSLLSLISLGFLCNYWRETGALFSCFQLAP